MDNDSAMGQGLAYAWGREDASGTPTVPPAGKTATEVVAPMEFGRAYTAGWEDYNSEARSNMIPLRDAYDHWQSSGGVSIFAPGESTAEVAARHAEYRRRMARS